MAGYYELGQSFPYAIRVPVHSVENIIRMLWVSGPQAPNGSSFAVTSNAPSGYRIIWLSDVSYETLHAAHVVPGLYPITNREDTNAPTP